MKPKVTFFGESLGPAVRDLSLEWVSKASNLLIIGSSLATFSAFRLIAAFRAGKKSRGEGPGEVGMINIGESRGDPAVDWRIDRSAGEILPKTTELRFQEMESFGNRNWEVMDAARDLLGRGVIKKVREGSATA